MFCFPRITPSLGYSWYTGYCVGKNGVRAEYLSQAREVPGGRRNIQCISDTRATEQVDATHPDSLEPSSVLDQKLDDVDKRCRRKNIVKERRRLQ